MNCSTYVQNSCVLNIDVSLFSDEEMKELEDMISFPDYVHSDVSPMDYIYVSPMDYTYASPMDYSFASPMDYIYVFPMDYTYVSSMDYV